MPRACSSRPAAIAESAVSPATKRRARMLGGLTGGAWRSYSARTTVEMPPRTWKSPSTAMRRGRSAATRSSRIALVTASK